MHFKRFWWLDSMAYFAQRAIANTPTVMFYLDWVHTCRKNSGTRPVILDADHCIVVI